MCHYKQMMELTKIVNFNLINDFELRCVFEKAFSNRICGYSGNTYVGVGVNVH